MLKQIVEIATVVIAILLMAGVLIQRRGSGLGMALGGEGNVYRTMRGAEKVIFIGTIVLSGLFLAGSFLSFYLRA
jgi:protein translocase SecG subunit